MKRMWINQPSTLQPLHHLHGMNVLVDEKDVSPSGESVTVYFLTGDVIKQYAPKLSLSKGWKN